MYNTNTANTKITVDTSKIKFFGGYNNNFKIEFISEKLEKLEHNIYIDKQNYDDGDNIFRPNFKTTKTLDIAKFLYNIDFVGKKYLINKNEDEIYELYRDFIFEYKILSGFNINELCKLITFDIELYSYKEINLKVKGYSKCDLITVYTKKEYTEDFLTNMFFDNEVNLIIEENEKLEENKEV